MMIRRFEVDRWHDVHVSQLKVNDEIFTNKDGICIVTGEPYLDDGKTVIPAKKPEPKDIVIDLSLDAHHPYVAEISDLIYVGHVNYTDGTVQLRDDEISPGCIYSPRMSLNELNDFCLKHKDKYYDFYERNKFQIENGHYPKMVPWWN